MGRTFPHRLGRLWGLGNTSMELTVEGWDTWFTDFWEGGSLNFQGRGTVMSSGKSPGCVVRLTRRCPPPRGGWTPPRRCTRARTPLRTAGLCSPATATNQNASTPRCSEFRGFHTGRAASKLLSKFLLVGVKITMMPNGERQKMVQSVPELASKF